MLNLSKLCVLHLPVYAVATPRPIASPRRCLHFQLHPSGAESTAPIRRRLREIPPGVCMYVVLIRFCFVWFWFFNLICIGFMLFWCWFRNWFHLVWFDLTCVDLNWTDLNWMDMVWLNVTWFGFDPSLSTVDTSGNTTWRVRVDLIRFGVMWSGLIWLDLVWPDLIWFVLIRFDLVGLGWVGFGLLSVDLSRFVLFCFGVISVGSNHVLLHLVDSLPCKKREEVVW